MKMLVRQNLDVSKNRNSYLNRYMVGSTIIADTATSFRSLCPGDLVLGFYCSHKNPAISHHSSQKSHIVSKLKLKSPKLQHSKVLHFLKVQSSAFFQ